MVPMVKELSSKIASTKRRNWSWMEPESQDLRVLECNILMHLAHFHMPFKVLRLLPKARSRRLERRTTPQ
eukprot:4593469-Amphidinium_carterae.1